MPWYPGYFIKSVLGSTRYEEFVLAGLGTAIDMIKLAATRAEKPEDVEKLKETCLEYIRRMADAEVDLAHKLCELGLINKRERDNWSDRVRKTEEAARSAIHETIRFVVESQRKVSPPSPWGPY